MPNKIINHAISPHITLNWNKGDLQKTRDGSPRDNSCPQTDNSLFDSLSNHGDDGNKNARNLHI